MNIELQGFRQLEQKFREAPKLVVKTGQNIIKKGAYEGERLAKDEAPVDKGGMRKSISARFFDNKVEIMPNKFYAKFVHDGTLEYDGDDRDYAYIVPWNRMRTEWNVKRTERVVQPFNPGGIRPDKFMRRARKKLIPKLESIERYELNYLIGQLS